MKLIFSKYQGTGNDFVMVDNMNGAYNSLSIAQVKFLCDRKLGVGADGLIILSKKNGFDFEVEYFNADGTQSFCGNGARCSVAFAQSIGLIDSEASFYAIDGAHKAFINGVDVRLEMLPVHNYELIDNDFIIDTGSPHYIHFVEDLEDKNIVDYGRLIRYSDRFSEKGVNVNTMATISDCEVSVATYERGVESETLSCGTGVTACALVFMAVNNHTYSELIINTKGGVLNVEAKRNKKEFTDIWLTGSTTFVFNGTIEV